MRMDNFENCYRTEKKFARRSGPWMESWNQNNSNNIIISDIMGFGKKEIYLNEAFMI